MFCKKRAWASRAQIVGQGNGWGLKMASQYHKGYIFIFLGAPNYFCLHIYQHLFVEFSIIIYLFLSFHDYE